MSPKDHHGGFWTSKSRLQKSLIIIAAIIAALCLALVAAYLAILTFIKPPAGEFSPAAWRPGAGFTVESSKVSTAAATPFIQQTITEPEDMAVDANKTVYISSGDGKIRRIKDGRQPVETFATVGGRPLGIAFDAQQNLIVANQGIGLQAVSPDGSVRLLTNTANDKRINFANDLAIADNGMIYFSDSNTKYNPSTLGDQDHFSIYDFLEGKPRGRLLQYNPSTGETSELLNGLYFPNGIAVSAAQDAVLITESTRYRITRYWLDGKKAGTTDVFLDNIPGILDGFTRTSEGNYLLPMYERSQALDRFILPYTATRHILVRFPSLTSDNGPQNGVILMLAADGQVMRYIKNITPSPSNVVEYGNEWLLGSLSDGPIQVMPRQK